jgi:hypothetical protein
VLYLPNNTVSHFSCLEHGGNELLQNDGTSPSNYMASYILYPEGGAAGSSNIVTSLTNYAAAQSYNLCKSGSGRFL